MAIWCVSTTHFPSAGVQEQAARKVLEENDICRVILQCWS